MLIFCAAPFWRCHLVRHTSYNIVYYSKDFWRDLWCLHQFCAFFGSYVCTSCLVLFCAAPCCQASLLGAGAAQFTSLRVLGGLLPLAPRLPRLLLSLRAVPSQRTISRRLLLPRPPSLPPPQPPPFPRRPPGLCGCGFVLLRRGMLRCRPLRHPLQPLRLAGLPCSRRRRLLPSVAAAYTWVRLIAFPSPPLSLRPSLRHSCPP